MRLDQRITKLATLSVVQKSEWRRLTGEPAPPAFGAGLLTRAIAYAMQEKEFGGLDKGVARRIDQLANKTDGTKGSKAPTSIKPGTWLSRTWHGEVHQVVVLESGFEYRGERYPSLSAVARHITGTGWSGPRFFGLHSPRLGKLGTTCDG
ncbi:MAG: DUF2924 domain-containing protein [Novosphingobium sp.]|nr:DUF2924 domain-containing protein [Novosphingobium sp.]